MRVVLDASVVAQGMRDSLHPSRQLVRLVLKGTVSLVASPGIDREYAKLVTRRSILRMLARHRTSPQQFLNSLADLRILATLVQPEGEAPPCRDERDRPYLHCAAYARVDLPVSADLDLLDIRSVEGVPIVDAREALRRILAAE